MTALGRHLASIPAAEFGAGLRRLSVPAQNEALRERFRYDRIGMVRWLWPDSYGRPFADVHTEVLTRPKTPWRERIGTQTKTLRALAAPRGFSKTGTIVADLAHDALYGLERVVAILSAELSLSRNSLRTVRDLLTSERVTDLYGIVKITGGSDRFTATTAQGHVCTFIAKSFGTTVRGLKDGTIRPTRVVIDDGEDKLKVNNPDQRRKWHAFLSEDVLKVGDLTGGLVVDWLGTVLHPDAVLARLLKAPGWSTRCYAACVKRPEREDLWAACGRIWADLTIGDVDARRAAAMAFYRDHRTEMDHGAEMLSSDWLSLFAWYEAVWSEGMSSVLKELQNDPRNSEDALIDMDRICACRFDGKTIHTSRGTDVLLADCKVGIWLDPSSGGDGSDLPAICVVARDRYGYRYWLEANGTRRRPSEQHAALWATWEAWLARGAKPLVGVDVTGTQGNIDESFDRMRDERRKAGKTWQMPLARHTFSEDKVMRLSTLEPAIHNGWIEVDERIPQDARDQLRDFPTGTHDDYLDALERADWLTAGGGTFNVVFTNSFRG